MKKVILAFLSMFFLIGCVNKKEINRLSLEKEHVEQQCDSLEKKNLELEKLIARMKDSMLMLSFPADQRILKIQQYISKEDFGSARKEIATLKKFFPHSKEAVECNNLSATIDKKIEEKKKEEERIKALGFKVLKEQRTVKVGAVTCSFSDFTFGKQFTYDYCPDVGYYSYNVADKDNVYILTSMTMSTKKNSAEVPSIDVYEIKGGKAYLETSFLHDYATWTNYGCYLGTYHDESHDFSKVNSVKYKLAAEISKELAKKPLIILTSKDGSHFSHELTIDEVVKNYYVLKFINRNKL